MNLILLTIDCLRADRLSCLGYSKKTTPNLDDLASGGALFTQAISVGPGTPTSFKAMFTSIYPLMYGGQLYITSSRTTLAQVLKEHGYHTAAFHSNPWLSPYFGYHKGFDTFDDSYQKRHHQGLLSKPRELARRIIGSGRLYEFLFPIYQTLMRGAYYTEADVISRKAISWLHDNPTNFFLWIHYMDCHEPYLPLSKFVSPLKKYNIVNLDRKALSSPDLLSPAVVNERINTYDSKITYVDGMIGSLLRMLEGSNILDDTFVIVAADHGQQFLEHGHYGHGHYLYDELTHVPLIINGPGLEGQVISQQVSLLDLAPTILDMLNIEKPRAFLGNSLLPLMQGNRPKAGNSEAMSEADTVRRLTEARVGTSPRLYAKHRRISLRTGKWKYIYTEGEQDELYCLEDDPKETQNIIDIKPEIATELRARIIAHIEFEEKSTPSEQELIKAKVRTLKASGKL
jgi:arylsulfatase A-like enzyme